MRLCTETTCFREQSPMDARNLRKPTLKAHISKEEWLQQYADRILKVWLKWQTPLGVARDYVEQLKNDLAEFYEEPLKKIFIETTY